MSTELDAIINSRRGEARRDRTAENHLQVAEGVQREIDETLTAAAAAAGGIEARLAHCHALASETHTIVDRLVGHAGRLLDEVHEVFGWDPQPPRDFRRRQCSSHAGRNT